MRLLIAHTCRLCRPENVLMSESRLEYVTLGLEKFLLSFFQRYLKRAGIVSLDVELPTFLNSDYSQRLCEIVNATNGVCLARNPDAGYVSYPMERPSAILLEDAELHGDGTDLFPMYSSNKTVSLAGEKQRRMPRSREFGMSCFSKSYVTFFEHSECVETRQSWTEPSLIDASGRLSFLAKGRKKPHWPVSMEVRLKEQALLVDLIVPERNDLLATEILRVFTDMRRSPALGHQVVCPFSEGYFSARALPEPMGADILNMSDYRRDTLEEVPGQRSLEDARRELSSYSTRIECELDNDPLVRAFEDGLV